MACVVSMIKSILITPTDLKRTVLIFRQMNSLVISLVKSYFHEIFAKNV